MRIATGDTVQFSQGLNSARGAHQGLKAAGRGNTAGGRSQNTAHFIMQGGDGISSHLALAKETAGQSSRS
ncbi:MAG: hypothetical protein BWY75_02842 [bacterium ADurb.Bin425]|nr:MAG: hypothetical protein BWY75_02842 [bacterium ADurb.Bin425]